MTSLFSPNHIIVIGASETPHSLGERIFTALQQAPFRGKTTPVNLRHKSVGGLTAYADLRRVPDAADMALILTPPASYESLLKACHKQQIPHAVLIQDWDNLPAEAWEQAQSAVVKSRKLKLNITVCGPDALQAPKLGLNAALSFPCAPAGAISCISGHSALLGTFQNQVGLGISRYIGLNFPLSPTAGAALLDDFAADPDSRLIVLEHNPYENQRALFSKIRTVGRRKPVILYCPHHTGTEERAILAALSRRCGFTAVFEPDRLTAAAHALLSPLPPARKLHVIANEPCGWLQTQAEPLGISLNMPSETQRPSENLYGYIGSTPATQRYRALAQNCLENNQTEALLAIVSPSADNSLAITQVLTGLQRQSAKPVFVSSPFSDGLLQFTRPVQALQTLYEKNTYTALKQTRSQTAKPRPAHVKTPVPRELKARASNPAELAKALHLPEYKAHGTDTQTRLVFDQHPLYGAVLYARTPGQTTAALPPFTTQDAERLIQQAGLKRQTKTIHQLLHSLNTAIEHAVPVGGLALSVTADGTFTHTTPAAPPAAENVIAPYPSKFSRNFTLKNGRNVRIRPLQPEDAETKQQFVRNLPDADRYTRYMAHIKELTPAMLAQASNLDYHCEGALAAEAADGTFLGVARISGTDIPGQCEFGISIAPEARQQGLAVHLMQQIIELARQQGYRQMSAEILTANLPMLGLARKIGFDICPQPYDKELQRAVLPLAQPSNNTKIRLAQQILAKKP